MTKKKDQYKRPVRVFSPSSDLDELAAALAAERERPIAKAYSKLFDFVNAAVGDPDFRHPDSRALLEFLLLVRDEMTDGINEQWDVDDIFAPMIEALSRHRGKQAKGRPKPRRKTTLRRGLEMLVAEGLTNDEILDLLSDADAISDYARDGFPFEVCDPESSVRDDGVLRYYVTGGTSEIGRASCRERA